MNTHNLEHSLNILGENEELSKSNLKELLEQAYQIIMNAERKLYLKNNEEQKGNGYMDRELGTAAGRLSLSVPRARDSEFRPQILPTKYQRDHSDKLNLIRAMMLSSYSVNEIIRALRDIGLHYSPNDMKLLSEEILKEYEVWNNRELPQDTIALFIDAYKSPIQYGDKVKKTITYVVQGIDFTGKKDIYGIYIYRGNENKEFWLMVLNNIIERGVKRTIMIITDDFSGLKESIPGLYPEALHQLCYVHFMRNIRRNMSREDATDFNSVLKNIKGSKTYEDAKEMMNALLNTFEPKYPIYIGKIRIKSDNYLAFMNMPKEIRKYLYTTNTVESFNSVLETIRKEKGGFFQSEDILKINIYIKYLNLKKRWRNGSPFIIKNLYYIRQIFAQIYGELPYEN